MSAGGSRVARLRGPAASPTRRMLRFSLGAMVTLAVGPVTAVQAAPPSVSITTPTSASVTSNQTPTISGTRESILEVGLETTVTVRIYAGALTAITPGLAPVQTLEVTVAGNVWSVTPTPGQALAPGTYTVLAEEEEVPEPVRSGLVTFTIDTTPPQVTLTSPANGSSAIGGSRVLGGAAGTEPGDLVPITVQLFAGSSIGPQLPLEAVTVQASQGSWSATVGGLNPGTYTARAEQLDEAGNNGMSAPVTFTLAAPPPPRPSAPPLASFKWFPSIPVVGEPVSLASSSTDQTSPLTAFAWALGSNAVFNVGKQVLTTTFTTPGDHVVRLRVTAADGLSSVASATLHVIRPPLVLMAPFPVVRIAGILTSAGVNLSVITAQAPPGARVRLTCRGRGCPTRSESRLVGSSSGKRRAGMVVLVFRRFERSLTAGVILEIKISKPGTIGKYTRLTIRHGKLPTRVDSCLDASGFKPIACPTS
ncbi:MAG: hypothetical protein JWN81_1287 [Solirubrobacterales bacterium]|nr:hypothetical protein [Solirubrobacterales bacterium]